jgi:hypothetical protein
MYSISDRTGPPPKKGTTGSPFSVHLVELLVLVQKLHTDKSYYQHSVESSLSSATQRRTVVGGDAILRRLCSPSVTHWLIHPKHSTVLCVPFHRPRTSSDQIGKEPTGPTRTHTQSRICHLGSRSNFHFHFHHTHPKYCQWPCTVFRRFT